MDKIINISGEVWAKGDFYELDQTVELVQNSHDSSQNGLTKIKHNIKYAKNGQVLNVIFNAETVQDDALVLKFARKTLS